MSFKSQLSEISKVLDYLVENTVKDSGEIFAYGITTDTRTLQAGQVFLALQGENFNGHDFLDIAIHKGAVGLIVAKTESVSLPNNIPVWRVDNTLEAYQRIAQWWREQMSIPVVAVTGSVGKTTTKELIAAVLSSRGRVHKTQANYNNEIGVAKTLLELDNDHDYAVIELAMRAKGEIAQLTQITRPTIGMITNVGTAHIGRLGSEEAIAEAKCELLREMPPTSVAVLNQDNHLLIKTAKTVWTGQTLTYGLEGGDIQGQFLAPDRLSVAGLVFQVPLPGRHHALNFLGVLAVAQVLGVDWEPLTRGMAVTLPEGRAQRYHIEPDILLLDETYNAGLESMLASLELLGQTPGRRRIAVLGTMKELGDRSWEFHLQVGQRLAALGLDALWVLADVPEAQALLDGALGIEKASFATHEALISHLQQTLQPGDRLLFKASHSVGLNRVVAALTQNSPK